MDITQTYNKIARDWHQDHLNDDWWQKGVDQFLQLLPTGAKVLDVGCAGGVKSKYMTDRGMTVVGIDISEQMVNIARAYCPAAEFHVMNLIEAAEQLPHDFDAVFAKASLLHLQKNEVPGAVKSLSKLLKMGGMFYIAMKQKRSDSVEEEDVTENDYGYDYTRHFSYFTTKELQAILSEAGFDRIQRLVYPEQGRWLQFIARKPT